MASFTLASTVTKPIQIGKYVLTPGTVYNDGLPTGASPSYAVDMSDDFIVNAVATGTLVFTDSTSLSEFQTNQTVINTQLDANVIAGAPIGGGTTNYSRSQITDGIQTPHNGGE